MSGPRPCRTPLRSVAADRARLELARRYLHIYGPATPGAFGAWAGIAGTWRRADIVVTVHPWRRLSSAEREAVTSKAESLPLPRLKRGISVRWDG